MRRRGFINVDFRRTKATDYVSDITRLKLPEGTVRRIESYHVIEHLARSAVRPMLESWYRALVPGGTVVIECPDFDQVVREYLDGNERRLANIFGWHRYPGDGHQFGWNFCRLKRELEAAGFVRVLRGEATDYHRDQEPCLRAEAFKEVALGDADE